MDEFEQEKEEREFNLTYILLVTGFSFLLFTLMLKMVDGVNIRLFLWTGLISFTLGLITGAYTLLNQASRRNKRNQLS